MKKAYFYSAFLSAYTELSRRVKTAHASVFFSNQTPAMRLQKVKTLKTNLFLPSAENPGHALIKQSLQTGNT
jgi:hypothetical protein